ncbi:hypothetical protein HYPSUDRAFT_56982 [Hypholoma sublateritium FD-334 SS-4]|uniref:Uncharacterized protein n=1 Tax=Hypholoma sublateritium (strain FD-334 SS-4) TaxID=945553 RepID=A0A0D2M650_HYPSF|nr:hypothetical protein HYPSUDRAFT_56982 [Hypholoma sublateritium FD-334 SS-4]
MTRWRDHKDKRGVKATKYVFTTTQEKILYDYGWELEQNIDTIAKGRNLKNNSHVTAWKKKNASTIIDLPEFKTLDLSEHSLATWLTAIVTWLTNYFNRYVAKVSTTVDTLQHARGLHSTRDGRSADKVLRSLGLFAGDLTPKEFFARENADLLKGRTEEILESRGNKFPHGAARNMALAELWDELTSLVKDDWKERAQALVEDVSLNRQQFPVLINEALQAICDRGRLGNALVSLHYAYRDDAGGLECGCTYAGTDVSTGKRINTEMNDHEQWHAQWRDYAEQNLPTPLPLKATSIKRKVDGTPLFPDIDTAKSAPEDVANVIEEYITALWAKASPASRGDRVLWTAIAQDPEMFYDEDQFKLPCPLKPAREMVRNLGHMYQLVAYLQDLQKQGTGFNFYRRSELPSDGSSDEMDYSKTSVAVKQLPGRAQKITPLPKVLATIDKTLTAAASTTTSRSANEAPAPMSSQPTDDVRIAEPPTAAPDKTVTATARTTSRLANDASAPTSSQPTDDVRIAEPPAAAPAAVAATTTSQSANEAPATTSSQPTAAAATTSGSTTVKLLGSSTDDASRPPVDSDPGLVTIQPAKDQAPAAAPTSITANTNTTTTTTTMASEQSVAKRSRGRPPKPENANKEKSVSTRKRKRDTTTVPGVEKELRSRDPKPVIPESMPARPAKKKKKVVWWRKTRTGREVPYYELSDWDSGDDTRLPDKGDQPTVLPDKGDQPTVDGKPPGKDDEAGIQIIFF